MAYLNLGTSLIALGRCHEAASVLRDGTKLDGTGLRDRTAHENARISSLLQLGGLYAEQGKHQRALAVYREALHTLPKNYPPQVNVLSIFLIYICTTKQIFVPSSIQRPLKRSSASFALAVMIPVICRLVGGTQSL